MLLPMLTKITQPNQRGDKHWSRQKGRLNAKDERLARLIQNPANFAEIYLGYDLHRKQREALTACEMPGCKVTIACCNEGGKTSRILPSLVLWHQALFPAGITLVTSGSYMQVESQIWPAIEQHKRKFPRWKWFETPRFETFNEDLGREGFFKGFTTNHPGRAEGAHEDGPDVPLLYIVDEAKTSPEWLRKVVEARVRPTRLILMSSHGFAEGWFYETHRLLDGWTRINISADDCPHIPQETIEQVKKDFAGQPEFVDSVLGYDFMPMIQDAVINGKALDECLANPPVANKVGERHAFCDFAWSGSGDQNVLALREGNVIGIENKFHCDHLVASGKNPTPGIVERFIADFLRLGLGPNQISGDEGGGGKLVMDAMDEKGWVLNRVNNGAPATDSEHYGSVGAEIWYEGSKHITNKTYVLPQSRTFRGQALSRKRTYNAKGKLMVETKEDMRKRGVASPDEADAVLGAMAPGGGFGARGISWAQSVGAGGGLEWSGRQVKW
jgi:hypothetical protein